MQIVIASKVLASNMEFSRLKGGIILHGKPIKNIITDKKLPQGESVLIKAKIVSLKEGVLRVEVLKNKTL